MCLLETEEREKVLLDGERLKDLENKERELRVLRRKFEALKKDRDDLCRAADKAVEPGGQESALQGCLSNGRTGLLRAMRDAFS